MRAETIQLVYNILIILGVFLTGIGGFGSYYYGKKVEKNISAEAEKKENILNLKIDSLIYDNKEIINKLTPFENLAKKMFPNEEADVALSKLQTELEHLKARTLDLESKSLPRLISEIQKKGLTDRLLKFYQKGFKKIKIYSVLGDQESFSYATQLKKIFESANWTVEGINEAKYDQPMIGFFISSPSDPAPDYINEFYAILIESGFDVEGNLNPQLGKSELKIIIGSKKR